MDVVLVDRFAHGLGVHAAHVAVQKAGLVELTQDGEDAAGAVHVFDVIRAARGDLAQVRYLAAHSIHVGHREVDAGFFGDGQDVQHRVGRTAHGDVESHRV